MIHRRTLGFWQGHIAYPLEQHVIDCLWNNLFPDISDGIVLNVTYNIDENIEWIYDIIHNHNVDAILLTSLVDPVAKSTHVKLCELSASLDIPVTLVGYCSYYFPDYMYLDFWALFMEQHFQSYTDKELLPDQFSNVFLSYNRKPHDHRVHLYESIHGNALDCVDVSNHGIITLGNTEDAAHQYGIVSFDNNITGIKQDEDLGDDCYGIKGTATALGNMKVWRSSFLHVVAETTADPYQTPFVTEKVYKAILGLRPFVVYGDVGYNDYLRSNGYKTFSDRLGIPDTFSVNSLNCAILHLAECDLAELYAEWLSDIMHNRENFYKHCAKIKHKFGITPIDK